MPTIIDESTKLPSTPSPTEAASQLAEALSAFTSWRANKTKASERIPDELWRQIFRLESYFTPTNLRSVFSVSSHQYKTMKDVLVVQDAKDSTQAIMTKPSMEANAPIVEPPSLCEVKIKDESKTSNVKKNLYALESLPSAKTLVVEFCRRDGQVMKIHTTQDSIPTLMQSFLGGEL